MKYRDKDGNVYADESTAIDVWCPADGPLDVTACRNCVLSKVSTGELCLDYARKHPAAAARLMGYEVIDDEPDPDGGNLPHICEKCLWESSGECADCKNHNKFKLCYPADCDETPDTCIIWGLADCALCIDKNNFEPVSKTDKEASMDKPLKDWTLGETQRECALHRRGGGYICEGCAFDFNECPFSKDWPEEWELEKPRFTPKEVEAAQWIQRIFPGMWDGVNCDKEGKVCLICRNGWEAAVNVNVFPSLRPGQAVKLSDILGDSNTDHGKEVKP